MKDDAQGVAFAGKQRAHAVAKIGPMKTVGGKLHVEYAKVDPVTHRPTTTANTGIVDVFDANGNFLQRLATNAHLNSPWGNNTSAS